MMLTHIFIKKMPRNVSGIHQVLNDGEPVVSVAALCPKASGEI